MLQLSIVTWKSSCFSFAVLSLSKFCIFFRILLVFCICLGLVQMWKLANMLIHIPDSGVTSRSRFLHHRLTFFAKSCLLAFRFLIIDWCCYGDIQRLNDSPFHFPTYVFLFPLSFLFLRMTTLSLLSTHRFPSFYFFSPFSLQLLPAKRPRDG